jgi:glycosyltransferase involved in cell wall biosynthesis
MPTVSIVQRILPHYRLAFFERLHALLEERGVNLRLCYGQEQPGTRPGSVELAGSWVHRVHNSYWFDDRRGHGAVWQPCLRELAQSDLVISEHAARLLINYPLAAMSRFGRTRLALWGHGKNLQAMPQRRLTDHFRAGLSHGAHWWFAYTALSARIVADAGFPSERITVVNNAIDTEALGAAVKATPAQQRDALRHALDLTAGSVAIFCGRLVAEKRLDLVRRAAELVHARRPEFRLIVVGDGPCEPEVRRMADECSWVHFVGPKFGAELAPYLAVSDLLLMPGLVGLVIVDSFAAEVPLITTDHGAHSPEIEYLRSGENALMTAAHSDALADEIVALIGCPDKLLHLRAGCRASAHEYTLARMVERFSDGVLNALAH